MRLKRRQGLQRRKSQPANVAHSWAYCVTSQACDLPLRLKDDSFYAAKVSARGSELAKADSHSA
jgi:hypothetical protein